MGNLVGRVAEDEDPNTAPLTYIELLPGECTWGESSFEENSCLFIVELVGYDVKRADYTEYSFNELPEDYRKIPKFASVVVFIKFEVSVRLRVHKTASGLYLFMSPMGSFFESSKMNNQFPITSLPTLVFLLKVPDEQILITCL